jgi:hypothetical protein
MLELFPYSLNTAMKVRMKTIHTEEEGTFVCNECDYAAMQGAVVIRHVKYVHEKVSRNKCNQCSYYTD